MGLLDSCQETHGEEEEPHGGHLSDWGSRGVWGSDWSHQGHIGDNDDIEDVGDNDDIGDFCHW